MILISSLLSGIEISIAGLSPFHYQKKYKEKIIFLLKYKETIISTLLIGNNICIVAATLALDDILGNNLTVYSKIGIFFLQILLFFLIAELLPKNIFRKLNSWILLKLYFVILIIFYSLRPISWFFMTIIEKIFKFFPESGHTKKEDIVYFIRTQFSREKIPVTRGLSSLDKTRAVEIMTPIPEVFSINKTSTVAEALEKIKGTSYSRYPVYEDRGDNIIGHIDVFDLLNSRLKEKIMKYVYNPVYVPENIMVDKVLHKMQANHLSMIFLVNEYGSVAGLITFENIVEEIIGADILARDQVTEKPYILKINKNLYELAGNLDLDDFNEKFQLHLEKADFETITGYIISLYGDIPESKTKINTDFGTLIIQKANKKTILSVHFVPLENPEN
jgi:CBS domain containing-hemolysin-like protein